MRLDGVDWQRQWESPRDCSLRTIRDENLSDSFDEEGMREALLSFINFARRETSPGDDLEAETAASHTQSPVGYCIVWMSDSR
jgi:hypothetical protein